MTAPIYDVYGIGHALLDLVYYVSDEFLQAHNLTKGVRNLVDQEWIQNMIGHLEAADFTLVKAAGGGSLCNSLSAMQKLGANSYVCAKVADDKYGRKFTKQLDKIKLNHARHMRVENSQKHTGLCLVMATPDYERTMCTSLGICNDFSTDDLDEAIISQSRTAYMEGYLLAQDHSREVCRQLCETAHRYDRPVYISLCDPVLVQFNRLRMQQFITENRVDCIFTNLEEALMFTGTSSVREAAEKLKEYAPSFVITMASDGLCACYNYKIHSMPAVPVHCVSTLGAGDCFAGGFLYAITHGHDFLQASYFANRCAARVVSHHGPRLKKRDVESLLAPDNIAWQQT